MGKFWKFQRGGGVNFGGQFDRAEKQPWESIEQLEIKNGGQNLDFYHKIRDQFKTYNMDFQHELCCLEFLQLLSSSRLLFSRQSADVFPNKLADIYKVKKMAEGDQRNTIQLGFLWLLRSYVNS